MSPPSAPPPGHIDADLDAEKAPETAANIRQHVAHHGAASMTTTAGQLNSKEEAKQLRKDAIGDRKVKGMTIDEEPPASFRAQGDPVTMKVTENKEGQHQGGKLGSGMKKASDMHADTTITHGISGESLADSEQGADSKKDIGSAAMAAKRRHAKKDR